MRQLHLPVLLNSRMHLKYFIGNKNRQILDFIETLFNDNHSSTVVVSGNQSNGKTHLLQGCTFIAMKKQLNAVYIDMKQPPPKGFITDLSTFDWVCIDNIDKTNVQQQQELFDLYNRIQYTQTKLIVSTQNLPMESNLFQDLKTRLSLAVNFILERLTDKQKITILQNKMIEKNININNTIYLYLFKHYSRDLNDLLNAINQLDESSLQKKSNITIPLIKTVLSI